MYREVIAERVTGRAAERIDGQLRAQLFFALTRERLWAALSARQKDAIRRLTALSQGIAGGTG